MFEDAIMLIRLKLSEKSLWWHCLQIAIWIFFVALASLAAGVLVFESLAAFIYLFTLAAILVVSSAMIVGYSIISRTDKTPYQY